MRLQSVVSMAILMGPACGEDVSTPRENSPITRTAETVGTRGIQLPLPPGSAVKEHTKGPGDVPDDVWVVEFEGSDDMLLEFYASELKTQGWSPVILKKQSETQAVPPNNADNLMRGCWTRPRPRTTEVEIVCVQVEEPNVFEIRLAP